MTINPYFGNYSHANTQSLMSDIVTEVIQQKGFDINYLCMETINFDEILGEAEQYSFANNNVIECYQSNHESWGNLGETFSKFGLQIQDQSTLLFSKARFMEVMAGKRTMPRNSDIIYIPFCQSFMQIKQFDYDANFWAHGSNPVYTVQCELWAYSGEEVNTGNTTIQTEIARYPVSANSMFIPSDNSELDLEKDLYIDFGEENPYLI